MTWVNNDGLKVKQGANEVDVIQGGSFRVNGPEHVSEIEITLADLALANASVDDLMVFDNVQIPAGHIIRKVEVVTETAATSGGAASLHIGLVETDYATITSLTGVATAVSLADMDTAGETLTIVAGDAKAGANFGAALATTGVLCADVNTAVYTAGQCRVRVYHYAP